MTGSKSPSASEALHLPDITNAAARVGVDVHVVNDYGVGIDCHSQFIQVCVIRKEGPAFRRYEREFSTQWQSLKAAHFWAFALAQETDRRLSRKEFRYTIESTGTYHLPVLRAWHGTPSVINPQLAGATKRKTDVLDARLLATHSLCGLWPASFVVDDQGEQLRLLLNMRYEAGRNATRALNRINNQVLRFGHTLGAEHSMADATARAVIEDLCRGVVPVHENLCPEGLPEAVRPLFLQSYALYDQFSELRLDYHKRTMDFVKRHEWPIAGTTMNGAKLLDVLTSVPGVGEVSALTWLSVVLDPNRFTDARQVAAFCGCDPSLKVSAGKVTSYAKRKGNARLHHVLKNVAAQLVRRRNEPLGQWGFGIQRRHAKGGWARAINAVSRRLAIFLWHVHRNGATFSFEQYTFFLVPDVQDVPVEAMNLDTRYTRLLKEAGMSTSKEVARAFNTSLPQREGIGAGCLSRVKEWLDQHRVTPNPDRTDRSKFAKTGSQRASMASTSPESSSGEVAPKRSATTSRSLGESSISSSSTMGLRSKSTSGSKTRSSSKSDSSPSVKKSSKKSASTRSRRATVPRTR